MAQLVSLQTASLRPQQRQAGRQRQQRQLAAAVRCAAPLPDEPEAPLVTSAGSRRGLLLGAAVLAASTTAGVQEAAAVELGFKKDLTNKRRQKVPEELYSDGPEGLKYYDVVVGSGAEAALGKRVVVHFEAKWKGVTVTTSRQGMGVTGGTPLGFDVGAKVGQGGTLKGLDLGVRGMRVGGRRKLIVPPNLAYGEKGRGEVPGNAYLDFDVELLSIKQDAVGYRVKLVEG